MHKIYWQAGLSNGETVTEGKGAFTETTGELSPIQRLLSYCNEKNLRITSLTICSGDGRRWTLPSAGANPKFRAFAEAPKPISYRVYRKGAQDFRDGRLIVVESYAVIEATYEDSRTLQLWVDEQTGNAWCLTK